MISLGEDVAFLGGLVIRLLSRIPLILGLFFFEFGGRIDMS